MFIFFTDFGHFDAIKIVLFFHDIMRHESEFIDLGFKKLLKLKI